MASNQAMTSSLPAADDGLLTTPLGSYSNIVLVIGLVAILGTLIIPLPTPLLDMLLACSISMAIAVLVITLSSRESLELSTFPSMLLFATLFRLSLNVASTRLILLQGDAGKIIQTFGQFVAGGSLVVGLVIFLILVIIQFIVITKGAERISEVAARFTLDAMPGKQMAIDADLNAGMITETQANERRSKIVKESEFYGAMDGASKFIRGDAKAGLVITAVNLVGGIAMGYARGMTITNAIQTYSILSIGDGLVSQIPSVIISISSGFLVTKISSSHSVGQDLAKQFLRTSQPLMTAACIIAAMAFVPGMPKVQFLMLAAGTALFAKATAKTEKAQSKAAPAPEEEDGEGARGGPARHRPHLRSRGRSPDRHGRSAKDQYDLRPHRGVEAAVRAAVRHRRSAGPAARRSEHRAERYEIRLSEMPVAKGSLEPDMFLAMDSGVVQQKVSGIKTTEPVYGLPALWIAADKKEAAELNGYTVIDPESVFITHLSETLKRHADELLTREDVQLLIDRLRKNQPSLVGEMVGTESPVSVGLLQRVLKNLLRSGIAIRELTTILEALAEHAPKTKNPIMLTEMVRKSLSRTITEQYKDEAGRISAITFDPAFEHRMVAALRQENGELILGLPAETALELNRKVAAAWRAAMDQSKDKVVLLCDARLRAPLAQMLARTLQMLPVVAYDEIILGTQLEPIETIAIQQDELETANGREQLVMASAGV